MKTSIPTKSESPLARPLAPEEVRIGEYVSALNETVECPSFLWCCGDSSLKPEELVRIRIKPQEAGIPLRVKAICLPFVSVQSPQLQIQILDLRKVQLVRLSSDYGKTVTKALSKQNRTTVPGI